MGFSDRLIAATRRNNSLVCVGLDPDLRRFPSHLRNQPDAIIEFNRAIIEATADLAAAYKPNLGFYVAYGEPGIRALVETRKLIPDEIPVILDAKVGDIGVTSSAYARGYFDVWGFDAVTVHPFLGADSLVPFLSYPDRGVFVLAKTSNPGSGDLQDLPVSENGTLEPLYLRVAERAKVWQEQYGGCGLVVGATWPEQLAEVRERCPELLLLVPGVGSQGGNLEATLRAGLDDHHGGLLINASRSIIYASESPDFAQAARTAAQHLRDQINRVRRVGSG